MDLLNFITAVILLTASGVLAPGPMFFTTLSYDAKSGARGGFIFSLAHMRAFQSLRKRLNRDD